MDGIFVYIPANLIQCPLNDRPRWPAADPHAKKKYGTVQHTCEKRHLNFTVSFHHTHLSPTRNHTFWHPTLLKIWKTKKTHESKWPNNQSNKQKPTNPHAKPIKITQTHIKSGKKKATHQRKGYVKGKEKRENIRAWNHRTGLQWPSSPIEKPLCRCWSCRSCKKTEPTSRTRPSMALGGSPSLLFSLREVAERKGFFSLCFSVV